METTSTCWVTFGLKVVLKFFYFIQIGTLTTFKSTGKAVFPDFFLERTKIWWKNEIIMHHKTIPFDGLWIDMNEPGTNKNTLEYAINWNLYL